MKISRVPDSCNCFPEVAGLKDGMSSEIHPPKNYADEVVGSGWLSSKRITIIITNINPWSINPYLFHWGLRLAQKNDANSEKKWEPLLSYNKTRKVDIKFNFDFWLWELPQVWRLPNRQVHPKGKWGKQSGSLWRKQMATWMSQEVSKWLVSGL